MNLSSPHYTLIHVSPDDAGIRLDRWFKRHYPLLPHSLLEKALRKGAIRLDNKKTSSSQRIEKDQVIAIAATLATTSQPLSTTPRILQVTERQRQMLLDSVLYKDDNIIALNKPAGLAVQGGSKIQTSLDALLDILCFEKKERPKLVHRLDKDTSGVLLLARSSKAAAILTHAFRHKTIEKHYWALVTGNPPKAEGKIEVALSKEATAKGYEQIQENAENGEHALTYYRTLEKIPGILSWLELKPVTGRTHQLRVHCKALGTPIVGDGKYGGKQAFIAGVSSKMHLHARELMMPDLFDKKHVFTAPLPPHMQTSWEMFGFSTKD